MSGPQGIAGPRGPTANIPAWVQRLGVQFPSAYFREDELYFLDYNDPHNDPSDTSTGALTATGLVLNESKDSLQGEIHPSYVMVSKVGATEETGQEVRMGLDEHPNIRILENGAMVTIAVPVIPTGFVGAGQLTSVEFRNISVCVDGQEAGMMVLASAPYLPL
jgi:hypothetical protein